MLKNILIGLSLILLSGCSLLIAPYDTNEYSLVNRIRTTSEMAIKDCSDKTTMRNNSETLFSLALELKNFGEYLPNNDQTVKPVSQLYTMIEELNKRYHAEAPVGKTYCELKLKSIEESSVMIQKAIGKRPRP